MRLLSIIGQREDTMGEARENWQTQLDERFLRLEERLVSQFEERVVMALHYSGSWPSAQAVHEFGEAASHGSECEKAAFEGDAMIPTAITPDMRALIEAYCERTPEEAFAFGLDVLARAAETMRTIVDETRRDLVDIETRRRQIDRTQARTREIIEKLVETSDDTGK